MDILRGLAETNGFFTRAEAFEVGYDDNAIRRAIKARLFTRVRQGAYTFTDLWSSMNEVARHLATAHAVVRRLGDRVALSHTSAALDHGLTVWDADLSLVHVTRLDGGPGRTEAGVVHHEGLCLDSDLEEVDGYARTKPARAALETATLISGEASVALFDAGLNTKRFTQEELDIGAAVMEHWPDTLHLQFAVRFADGRAESVGESRSRYLCCMHGLPAPDLQFHVYDAHGHLVGISDMAWVDHRLLGEFDGKVKYGRLLKPGEHASDVVFREKQREDALRRVTGFSMIRITWADLYRGAATAAEIRRLMRQVA